MNQYDIKMRLYRSILFVGALLSVICIIGNYLSSFPFWPNLKWIALFLTTVTSYLFSKNKNYTKVFMFGFFFHLLSWTLAEATITLSATLFFFL